MTTPTLNNTTPTRKVFEQSLLSVPDSIAVDLGNFEIDQRANGRAEETIQCRIRALKQIAKLMDLNSPETVKLWLSKLDENKQPLCRWSEKTKVKFCDTYTSYLNFKGMTWKAPKYTLKQKDYFIPTEEEIDLLISGCGRTTATALLMLKETGMRIGELCLLKWEDLDPQRKLISVTPEKGSNPRTLPVSETLLQRLAELSKQHSPNIFQPEKKMLREYFSVQRKALAQKLGKPRLQRITFHTFRHWKATIEYHRTLDIKHVQWMLGHKHSNSTDVYVTLEKSLFTSHTDECLSTVSHSLEEEMKLINDGWTLVRAINETTTLYKKRKQVGSE